jgi:hypothetical protein
MLLYKVGESSWCEGWGSFFGTIIVHTVLARNHTKDVVTFSGTYHDGNVNFHYSDFMLKCHYTVKKIKEFLEFFLPNLSDSGKNLC